MKISAFVTVTEPDKRQDPWRACIESLKDLVDEIVVVCGSTDDIKLLTKELELHPQDGKLKLVYLKWPHKWCWDELPKHLNVGLKHCTGDWVIRVDADYVFKPNQRELLEKELKVLGSTPVATMQKFSAVLSTKFYQKGGIKMLINKKDNGNILFGRDLNKYTDLCVPIYWEDAFDQKGVPVGQAVPDLDCGRTHVEFFNYDYTFKTKELTKSEFNRFSLAHREYFGYTNWGLTPNESLKVFMDMMKGRIGRCVYNIPHQEQPEPIKPLLKTLTSEQFGFNGWGKFV